MLFFLFVLYLSRIPVHASPPLVLRDSAILSTPCFSSSSPSVFTICTCSDARSIWDIIWSCLATIFACSWVSVHPNIPAPGEQWWRGFLRRLECMLWAVLAPEAVIYWAMRQWFGARTVAKEYQDKGWTKTHGHYLQMGGFILYEGDEPKGILSEDRFRDLLNQGRIQFPSISKEDIDDRSKSDAFAKAVAVIQTGWFIVQCITRKAEGLVTTELELLTLALASLNAFMYFFWWDKPLDVGTSVPVYLIDEKSGQRNEPAMKEVNNDALSPSPNENHDSRPNIIIRAFSAVLWRWPKALISPIIRRLGEILVWGDDPKWTIQPGDMQAPTFYAIPLDGNQDGIASALTSLIGILFGAIHCAGWNFFFPTHAEQIIWRVSSVATVVAPAFLAFPVLVVIPIAERMSAYSIERILLTVLIRVLTKLSVLLGPVYIVARCLLLVEAAITLRDLPAGAYDDIDWTSFLPHV